VKGSEIWKLQSAEKENLMEIISSILAHWYNLLDAQKSRVLLEPALQIKERRYGMDHPEVAVTLTSLGSAYQSLGDYKKVLEFCER